jgi:hypothetical protein
VFNEVVARVLGRHRPGRPMKIRWDSGWMDSESASTLSDSSDTRLWLHSRNRTAGQGHCSAVLWPQRPPPSPAYAQVRTQVRHDVLLRLMAARHRALCERSRCLFEVARNHQSVSDLRKGGDEFTSTVIVHRCTWRQLKRLDCFAVGLESEARVSSSCVRFGQPNVDGG